ncbi:MAG: hypothetical protein JXA57_12480 [Armatimonadetes bacterium]|nr:hypothetical protein [Armatimonadota bacterium]
MKKTLTLTIVLAVLLVLAFAGSAFAAEPQVVPLMAGQHTQVGTVTVSNDGANMTVTYDITVDGWFLTTTHLYVGTKEPKKSAPGQFPYKHEDLYATSDTFTVTVVPGTKYYVAAHADVLNENDIIGYDCPTLEELAALLPDSVLIKPVNYPNAGSYVDLTLSGGLSGTFPAYCIDATHTIYLGSEYAANVYSSFEQLPDYLTIGDDPGIDNPENLDLVNWVVNQRFIGKASPSGGFYTSADVQDAIWILIDDNPAVTATQNVKAAEIVQLALTYGEGFRPNFAAGDVFTIILAPVAAAGYQTTIAQILLAELGVECTPIYKSETAWALGGFDWKPWKTGWGQFFVYIP